MPRFSAKRWHRSNHYKQWLLQRIEANHFRLWRSW